MKIDLERLSDYFKINKLKKKIHLIHFKDTNILLNIRFTEKEQKEETNDFSIKSPLSGAFNPLKWKFYVDIVSTGQQCLVKTKSGTARICKEEATKSDRNSPTSKMVLSTARN